MEMQGNDQLHGAILLNDSNKVALELQYLCVEFWKERQRKPHPPLKAWEMEKNQKIQKNVNFCFLQSYFHFLSWNDSEAFRIHENKAVGHLVQAKTEHSFHLHGFHKSRQNIKYWIVLWPFILHKEFRSEPIFVISFGYTVSLWLLYLNFKVYVDGHVL